MAIGRYGEIDVFRVELVLDLIVQGVRILGFSISWLSPCGRCKPLYHKDERENDGTGTTFILERTRFRSRSAQSYSFRTGRIKCECRTGKGPHPAIDGGYNLCYNRPTIARRIGTRYCRPVGQARAKPHMPPQDKVVRHFDGRKEERRRMMQSESGWGSTPGISGDMRADVRVQRGTGRKAAFARKLAAGFLIGASLMWGGLAWAGVPTTAPGSVSSASASNTTAASKLYGELNE